jgi:hypothetical protein
VALQVAEKGENIVILSPLRRAKNPSEAFVLNPERFFAQVADCAWLKNGTFLQRLTSELTRNSDLGPSRNLGEY